MKLMKTQGASDAMQMAHYKLTIIIIIIIIINRSNFLHFISALLTNNYIVVPLTEPMSFVQVATDFSQQNYIKRPETISQIKTVKVSQVGYAIHICWFADASERSFNLTKITSSTNETFKFNVTSENLLKEILFVVPFTTYPEPTTL